MRSLPACLLALCAVLPGQAEDLPADVRFPERPIRIIVYTGPGGMIDFTARKFADLARRHDPGQPFVVINKPGAGGVVAFEEVLRQPADGYHLLAVTRSNISKIVSVGRDDLLLGVDWFAYLMDNPHVVIANRAAGHATWEDVRRDSGARGGRQIWLGADIGGVKHASALHVWDRAGIEARWIPYASGGQATAALLGEIGQVYFGNPSDGADNPALQLVAVCAARRMAAFPDTPTFAELGVPGLENELIWRGFAFRKGTPEPVLRWYENLIRKVVTDPEWRDQWEREGINIDFKPAAEFEAIVAADHALFRETLAPLGLLRTRDDRKWWGLVTPSTAVALANLLLAAILVAGGFALSRSRLRGRLTEVSVAGALLFAAASCLLLTVLLPPPNAVDQVGAAGVPRLWATALLLLAGWQILAALRSGESPPTITAPGNPSNPFPVFAAGLGAYLLGIQFVGYHLATLVFLPAACWWLGFRRGGPVAAMALGWLTFAYFVFQRAFFVDLPAGWLARTISG